MAYNQFKFPSVLSAFGLTLQTSPLFSDLQAETISSEVLAKFERGFSLAQAIDTEKARSEWIIAPILLEVLSTSPKPFGLFSGVELKAESDARLNGVCDFLLTRDINQMVPRAPFVTIVEAKNDNVRNGLGQCIAEMVAAQWNNEQAQVIVPVFGITTTGSLWQFLRLDGTTVTIDAREYTLGDLGLIFAFIHRFVLEAQTSRPGV